MRKVQFLINEKGEKTAVVLSISEYERLLSYQKKQKNTVVQDLSNSLKEVQQHLHGEKKFSSLKEVLDEL